MIPVRAGVQPSPENSLWEMVLNGIHGPVDRFIPFIPSYPLSKDIFPNHDTASVHPGGMKLSRLIVAPPVNGMLHMTSFEPFIAIDTGDFTVFKTLGPTTYDDSGCEPAEELSHPRGRFPV